MRSTERLIELLTTVNADAVDNDCGRPGQFLAKLCNEAAVRLRELQFAHQERMEQVGEFLAARGYDYLDRPARTEELGTDEIIEADPHNESGC